MNRCKSIRKV